MKTALVVLAFFGSGLIGALASRELFPAEAPPADSPADYAALEARVADLAGQVERLTDDMRARRDAALVPDAPSTAKADAAEPIPGAPLAPDAPAPTLTDERIEKKVEETIAKISRERQAEKARQVEAETRKKEREWLLAKQKELGLTDYQVNEFAKLLILRRERYAPLKAGWNQATPEEQARRKTEMEDISRELRGELQKLLSTDQYDSIMRTNGKK